MQILNKTVQSAVFVNNFPEIREVNLRTLTERQQLINLLNQPAWVILVAFGEINMIPLIIQNKTQSFITV
jgi:hypothetical protein